MNNTITVPAFDYAAAPYPVRADIVAANRLAWDRLAAPGNWWSGAERVAIAAEVRNAATCRLCQTRLKEEVDASAAGHDHAGALPPAAVEAVHRISSEPARLRRDWYEDLLRAGLSDAQYVEIVGIVVTVICIDAFHRGLGLALEPLPGPRPGAPSRYRPATAMASDQAWVPMISKAASMGTAEADLYPGAHTGNVITAMSLVPDMVRLLNDTHTAHYVDFAKAGMAGAAPGWTLRRPQIELIATRTSVLNHCRY